MSAKTKAELSETLRYLEARSRNKFCAIRVDNIIIYEKKDTL